MHLFVVLTPFAEVESFLWLRRRHCFRRVEVVHSYFRTEGPGSLITNLDGKCAGSHFLLLRYHVKLQLYTRREFRSCMPLRAEFASAVIKPESARARGLHAQRAPSCSFAKMPWPRRSESASGPMVMRRVGNKTRAPC